MECSSVDFPETFSPGSMTIGGARSTIIGMWKFRFVKTGCARILRNISTLRISVGREHLLELPEQPLQCETALRRDLKPGLRLPVGKDLFRLNVIPGFQLSQMRPEIAVRYPQVL